MAVATPQEKRIEGQNARWDKFRLLIREEFPDAFADLQRVNSPEAWAAYLDKYPQYNFDPEVYAGPIKAPLSSYHADTTPISAPAPLPGTEAATGIAFLPIGLLFAPKAQTYEEDGKYQKMVRQITKEQQKKWKEEQKKTKGEKVKEGDKRWVDFMHGSLGQGKDDTPSIHDRARIRFRSKYADRAKKYDQKEAEIKKSDKKDRSVAETRAHVSHEYTDRLILLEKEWEEKRKALEKDKALRKSLSSKQWREKKEAFEKEKEEARNDLYKKVQEKHWDYYTAAHPEKVKAYAQQIEEQKKKEKNEKKKKEYDQIDIAQAQKRKEERDARNISTQQASERLDTIANPQPQTQPVTLINAQQQVISTTQAPQIPQPVVPEQLPPAPPAQPSFQPPILSTPTQVLTPANPIILPSSQVNSSTLVSPSGRPISSVQQPAPPVAHPQGLVDVHQQPLPNTQSTHPAVTNQPVQQQPKEKKKGRLKRFTDRIDHIKDRFDVKRILKDKIKAKINSMLSDRAKNLLGKFGRFQKFLNPGQMARNYAQQAGRFVAKQAANAARSGARLAAQGMRVVAQMAMQVAKQAAVMAAQALASAAASAGSALVAAASPFIGIGALIVIGVILAILLIIIIVVVIGCVLGWFPCGEPPPGEETTTTQSPIPGLTLELEGPTTIQNSDNISYSISVSYTGDLDVTITDPLLTTNSSFVSATGVYTPTTPTTQVMWRLNDNPTTPISTAESTKKYTFSIVLKPNRPDSVVKNKVVARAQSVLSGNIADILSGHNTPLSPKGIALTGQITGLLQQNPNNITVYKQAEQITGVPWQILAGIHYVEGGMGPNKSLVSGREIGTNEPDIVRGGGCSSGNSDPGAPKPVPGGCGFTTLLESAIYAGNHLKQKTGGSINNIEEVAKALSMYNGGGNRNCFQPGDSFNPRTPWNGCPRQFVGEDDPYVFNNFDTRHENMYLVYCADLTPCSPPRSFGDRLGSMSVAKVVADNF